MKTLTKQGSHSPLAFDPSWKALLECAVLEVFEMMAGVRLEPRPESGEEPSGELTAMVGLAGATCGMITLRCSTRKAGKFASLMLGGDAAANPSTVNDAVGELCNMIAGNFKAKVSSLADHCMLSVPTVIAGDDYAMSPLEPSEGVTLGLNFEGEVVWVSLVTHS
jgi:chemotaxis protein CheX